MSWVGRWSGGEGGGAHERSTTEEEEEEEEKEKIKRKNLVSPLTLNFQTLTMRLMRLTSPTDAKNRSSVMARRRAA